MKIPDGRILLVVAEEGNITKYCRYLEKVITFDMVKDLNEAYRICLQTYYDLVFIDLRLCFGSGQLQMEKMNSLSYPPPIFKIRPRNQRVEVILQEQRTVEELVGFLDNYFKKLKEEDSAFINLRKYVRFKSILRLIVQKKNQNLIRANTLDISQGGLFVTTTHLFKEKEELIVQIHDLVEKPIQVTMEVVWFRPWEIPFQLPGIGACFIDFNDSDRYIFAEYIKNNFLKV